MKILVTGGAGFLGSHLVEFLISKGHFPIIVDNLSSGNYNYIKKFIQSNQAKFFKIDVRDFGKVSNLAKTKIVIHLAAIASVVKSITNPPYVNEVNVNGTLNMLEFCRKKSIKKFIFISSAAVFGRCEKTISENTPKVANTIYGSSKLIGEDYCRIYSELFGINCVVLRPFNIYGARQNDEYAGVISKFISRITKNRPPIIFGDGKQTRDFIHVDDICRAIGMSLNYKNNFEIFNVATGKSISINQLAKILLRISNKQKFKPIYKKPIPGVVIYSSVKIQKIKKLLRFKPTRELNEGLSELLRNHLRSK